MKWLKLLLSFFIKPKGFVCSEIKRLIIFMLVFQITKMCFPIEGDPNGNRKDIDGFR